MFTTQGTPSTPTRSPQQTNPITLTPSTPTVPPTDLGSIFEKVSKEAAELRQINHNANRNARNLARRIISMNNPASNRRATPNDWYERMYPGDFVFSDDEREAEEDNESEADNQSVENRKLPGELVQQFNLSRKRVKLMPPNGTETTSSDDSDLENHGDHAPSLAQPGSLRPHS